MEEIRIKSRMVTDVVNLVLADKGMSVDKIYLVGSYASEKANEYSDIDYLVVVKGGNRPHTYPNWSDWTAVKKKVDNPRIHCIFATSIDAQQSLYMKNPVKYAYREL